jgi:hypothetical protein
MTTKNHPYYVESGNINPGRLALGLLFIAGVSFVLAYIYSLIMYYSPLVYINGLVCAGFGLFLGLMANTAGRIAHVRSLWWRIGFGLVAGVLGYVLHWVAYIPLVLSDGIANPVFYVQNLSMLGYPGETVSMIELINSVGIWEIFGVSNSGGVQLKLSQPRQLSGNLLI